MNILLFDNDEAQLSRTRETLLELPGADGFQVAAFTDVAQLEAHLAAGNTVDVAIMDIDLGEGEPTGIDLVKRYFGPGSGTQVVYLTGYVEYCTEVYETGHVYFLLKPATGEQVARALEKAIDKLGRVEQPVSFISNRAHVEVLPKSICYIETINRKTLVHLDDGHVLETHSRLGDIHAQLPERFVLSHKSFLVNLDKVAQLGTADIRMEDGTVLPISQARKEQFRRTFMTYLHKSG